jgi:hypothetical protein
LEKYFGLLYFFVRRAYIQLFREQAKRESFCCNKTAVLFEPGKKTSVLQKVSRFLFVRSSEDFAAVNILLESFGMLKNSCFWHAKLMFC